MKKRLEWDQELIDRWLLLPFHEADEAYRIHMQYETMYKFANISAGMEHVLVQLLRMIASSDKMHHIRSIRNAKYGKMIRVKS